VRRWVSGSRRRLDGIPPAAKPQWDRYFAGLAAGTEPDLSSPSHLGDDAVRGYSSTASITRVK